MKFFFDSPKNSAVKTKNNSKGLMWQKDESLQKEMAEMVSLLEMDHVQPNRVFCYRTSGSKAGAYARIWSFPKIFQQALDIKACYVMEIISEKYDKLNEDNKKKVIIHELLHIPKNFSGSLLPHKYGNTKIDHEVDILFSKYKESNTTKKI